MQAILYSDILIFSFLRASVTFRGVVAKGTEFGSDDEEDEDE